MTDTGSGPFYDPPAALNQVNWQVPFGAWPYHDLELKQPTCPNCGTSATMFVAPFMHPTAWCQNDDCPSITWDPSKSAVDVLWHLLDQEGRKQLRPESAPG